MWVREAVLWLDGGQLNLWESLSLCKREMWMGSQTVTDHTLCLDSESALALISEVNVTLGDIKMACSASSVGSCSALYSAAVERIKDVHV